MIAFVLEMVIGKIIGLFMSQRWYMALLYTFALLSLVVLTVGGIGYLLSLWLFRPEDFRSPLMIAASAGAVVLIVALWVAFSMLQRRVFK